MSRRLRRMSAASAGGKKPSRGLLVVLLIASLAVITLDARGGDSSPIDPVRAGAGDLFGPAETATATAVRPFTSVPRFFRTTGELRHDVSRLQAENSHLRSRLVGTTVDRHRVAELDGLTASARSTGYALLPARVVAMGPAQNFSRTVTIDAGRSSGVRPDMTVLNNDGLVGRVLRSDRSTATVLLLVDSESVVGGRLGSSMEVGFVRGKGALGDKARLALDLVDPTATAARDDVLVTWGSKHGAPYVSGVPIGKVAGVYSSPRQQSTRAAITPFVDFTSLDLVGVVVKKGAHSDRTIIKADGGLRAPGAKR